eukprot:654154-Amphidinium_carterae.1
MDGVDTTLSVVVQKHKIPRGSAGKSGGTAGPSSAPAPTRSATPPTSAAPSSAAPLNAVSTPARPRPSSQPQGVKRPYVDTVQDHAQGNSRWCAISPLYKHSFKPVFEFSLA